MKSEVKTFYTCSFCGKTSQSEEKIKECEKSHVVLGGDETVLKQTFKKSGVNTTFPDELVFNLPDGTDIGYRYAWVNKAHKQEPTK